ncbi:hypothetical protein LTR97_006536 [Elasticomyces elasticus]|uniref:Uncharacterized protein n=1 Tax=Elasticomyces elasticus TaxID=574655 RepID=A0AAN7WA12_9PEZI|nr:hypothetical protein LTR97_006536 [Elasticomyces elasticus]
MDNDTEPMMLVYAHKPNGRGLVPNGVSLMTEYEIIMSMSCYADDGVYMLTKPIKAGQIQLDLYKVDLLTEDEKNDKALPEGVKNKEDTPWRVFLGHEWEGHSFTELTILAVKPQTKPTKNPSESASTTSSSDGESKHSTASSNSSASSVSMSEDGIKADAE